MRIIAGFGSRVPGSVVTMGSVESCLPCLVSRGEIKQLKAEVAQLKTEAQETQQLKAEVAQLKTEAQEDREALRRIVQDDREARAALWDALRDANQKLAVRSEQIHHRLLQVESDVKDGQTENEHLTLRLDSILRNNDHIVAD